MTDENNEWARLSRNAMLSRGRASLALSIAALILSHQLTPSACFAGLGLGQTVTGAQTTTMGANTKRGNNHDHHYRDGFDIQSVNHPNLATRIRTEFQPSLPAWLMKPKSHLAESRLEALQNAMRSNGMFTEEEVLKLQVVIEKAAAGDANKIAGAAEFCLILVTSMEMGIHTLTAAAFHYCSCVSARERESMTATPTKLSDIRNGGGHPLLLSTTTMESIGDYEAIRIARDAAHLKQLERLAETIVEGQASSAGNFLNLLLSETEDWRALAIRAAACLYRLRGILETSQGTKSLSLTPEIVRVCRAALRVYAPLASRLGFHRLKNELEGSAFRILYKRQYETVNALARQIRSGQQPLDGDAATDIGQSMRRVMTRVQKDMTRMLSEDPAFAGAVDSFSVTARVKEPYSMWQKMLSKQYDHILQVPDAIALRIVLDAKKLAPNEAPEVTRARERDLCYYAQKLCTEHWKPVPGDGRFKDYIASPKPNGYQSLHYTAATEWAGEAWTLEIQIRSFRMHQVAEYGVASHFSYKANKKNNVFCKEQSVRAVEPMASEGKVKAREEELMSRLSMAHLDTDEQEHWKDRLNRREVPVDAESRVRSNRIRARMHLEPYIRALTAAKSDLVDQFVFVFLAAAGQSKDSGGNVLALPAGSSVLDALEEGGKIIKGFDKQTALRATKRPSLSPLLSLALNGTPTSAARILRNGDVVTLPILSTVMAAGESVKGCCGAWV